MTDREKFCQIAKVYMASCEKEDKIVSALENVDIYISFENERADDNYVFLLEEILDNWFKEDDNKPIVEALLDIINYGEFYINDDKSVSTPEEIYDYYKE